MTPENWISIVGIAVGAFVAVGLAMATAVGGVLAWFVQRGLQTLKDIREEVGRLSNKLTESVVRYEHTISRLDQHEDRLDVHDGKHEEHLAEIAALKARVP